MTNQKSAWHCRGYLPHFDEELAPQSLTFRLGDSLPKHVLEGLAEQLKGLPKTQASNEQMARIDEYLDKGLGETYLARAEIARLVEQALKLFDRDRYHLHAWAIMPNHVHVLATPAEGYSVASIMHSWKSYTANKANVLLGRSGTFWQKEYFDRMIRSEKHFADVVEYIENNPVKAGLCESPADWPFSSARLRG